MIPNFIFHQIRCANVSHHTSKKVANRTFAACFSGGAVAALASISIATVSTALLDDGKSIFNSLGSNTDNRCKCEEEQKSSRPSTAINSCTSDDNDMFYNYFPKSQLFQPKRSYPAWDDNWDGREQRYQQQEEEAKLETNGREGSRESTTRHLILIRHGQYDETYKEDTKRHLTKLGREQAHLTGKRLAEIVNGINEKFQPCNVKTIRVSNMTRAKETASIISEYLPKENIVRDLPDPLLNEGIPAQIIPKRPELDIDEDLAKNGTRIEKAFTKYFYRKTAPQCESKLLTDTKDDSKDLSRAEDNSKPKEKHEFDIIVCHGNVIRYFFCRALQLPPEAWLRLSIFNCSLTYLMIMPNGRVSCRMLGDIGHLGYGQSTFSMHHGFNW